MLRPVMTGFSLVALSSLPVMAQIARPVDLVEMSQLAGRVVVGHCTAVTTETLPGYNHTFVTKVTLAVHQVLKGGPTQTFSFLQYGKPNDLGLPHLKSYRKGDEVLLLLYPPSKIGLTSPVGIEQGRFMITTAADGTKLAQNGRGNLNLLPNLPASLSAEERVELTEANQGQPVRLALLTKVLQRLIDQN